MTMYAEERQQAIARAGHRARPDVGQPAGREYDVTTETVRRDLSTLERMGLVRRVHGGVVPPASLSLIEAGLRERDQVNTESKERIAARRARPAPARRAARSCSTPARTTSRLASLLPPDHELTVDHPRGADRRPAGRSAPDRPAAAARAGSGGRPRRRSAPTPSRRSRDLRVDVAFLGTNGITAEHGLTTPDPDEAAVKRALVASARQVVALADASQVRHRDRGAVRRARRDRRPGHRQRRVDRRPPGAHEGRHRGDVHRSIRQRAGA